MDPLSLTASIIAVLQLTVSLTSYLSDVRNATSDQKKLAIEATSLSSLLTSLRYRVDESRATDEWFNNVRLLGVDNGPLKQFEQVLEEMIEQTASTKLRARDRIKSALSWNFTKSKVDASLQHIERLKSLINIALSNDALSAIRDEVKTLSTDIQQVQNDVEQLRIRADRNLDEILARWLQVPDPSTNYRVAQKKRHPGTGSWLLDNQIFKRWKTSTSSLLWIHGKAGSGKTVLSATALENILYETLGRSGATTSYFYFDFNSVEKRRTQHAVRSLLFQFATQLPGGSQLLERLYQHCRKGQQQPDDDQIRSLLQALIERSEQAYIILDALDECEDRNEMLNFLEDLVTSPQQDVCILVTSRLEKDISEALQPVADHSVNIQSAVVDHDIDMYIQGQLNSNRKLRKWPTSVKDEIAEVLRHKADGMFRWVFCQLESLQRCVQLRDLRAALSSLPRTLDETYDRILDSIAADGHLPNAITVLQWLCFARRPLRLNELVDVLAIERGAEKGNGFDPEQRMPDPNDILTICSSLISPYTTEHGSVGVGRMQTKYDSDKDSYDGDLNGGQNLSDGMAQIRLAHFSVQEYLLSDRCRLQSDFQAGQCQSFLAESCLLYLQHLGRNPMFYFDMIHAYPLAEYAGESWWRHAQDIQDEPIGQITDLAYGILMDPNALLTWQHLNSVDSRDRNGRQLLLMSADELASPLYYTAIVGLSEVAQRMVEQQLDINARGKFYGSALQAASAGGSYTIVRMLIEAGADVNAQGGIEYGSAVRAAAAGGYDKIAQMLIEAGADVNARGGNDAGTALYTASTHGHKKLAQMLIEAGANVDVQGGVYGSVLLAAAIKGHEEIVQMLIKAGAEVDVRRAWHGSPLQVASLKGSERIVQMLVDAGAEDRGPAPWYGTDLQVKSPPRRQKTPELRIDTRKP